MMNASVSGFTQTPPNREIRHQHVFLLACTYVIDIPRMPSCGLPMEVTPASSIGRRNRDIENLTAEFCSKFICIQSAKYMLVSGQR